ncbi:uracil-xanthine permease family protein [Saccharopolyspora sp. 5N102]|uniref:uracil-xanthine permease family protein n=1 Tax=Saccharopolyspora sp. 5N102 TaxID=3375155 RepID=UPI0037BA6326
MRQELGAKLGVGWKLHGDGSTPRPGEAVAPDERLSWGRTIGLGAQHVVAMFGATFVFPVLMGLDPNLAIMVSGVATILFLLIVQGKIPSYLGSSASFVGVVTVIRAGGGDSSTVTGAILVLGCSVLLRGFWSRIAVLIGLVVGYVLSWLFDLGFGPITAPNASGEVSTHLRLDLSGVADASWFGLPTLHAPSFDAAAILVVLPVVIALIAENTGHVKAVEEMTGTKLDGSLGRAIFADGFASTLSSAVGGPPTTTYAENIGVMAATRVYSTAAYWVAAIVAILFGLCPKFGEVIAATPGGVLGGITVVLYGMIGLLGAKIWTENRVDFGDPVNLMPLAAGLVAGIGGVSLQITPQFSLSGIALGTIVTLLGYHVLRRLVPARG